jgi:hypothetical protein
MHRAGLKLSGQCVPDVEAEWKAVWAEIDAQSGSSRSR